MQARPRNYAVFHSPTDHRYRHARWTGTAWQDRELTPAGSFFPDDGGEKQYSGGVVFDHANPAVLYLSRQVAGQWQIERWETPDDGATWSHRPLTAGSLEKNVRPAVARGGGPLWMRGGYVTTGATAPPSSLSDATGVPTTLRPGRCPVCARVAPDRGS